MDGINTAVRKRSQDPISARRATSGRRVSRSPDACSMPIGDDDNGHRLADRCGRSAGIVSSEDIP